MTEPQWQAERQALEDVVNRLDGRLLMVVGIASGADARLLHHVAHALGARHQDREAA